MSRRIHSTRSVLSLALAGVFLVAATVLVPPASAATHGRNGWERGRSGSQVRNQGQVSRSNRDQAAPNRGRDRATQNRRPEVRADRSRGATGQHWQGRRDWNGGRQWQARPGTRVPAWRGPRNWYRGPAWGWRGAVIVRPFGPPILRRPFHVIRPFAPYHHPWWAGAPEIMVFDQPYYYQASLGVYLGGIALSFDLSSGPPPGYLYYDPYCQLESDTLEGYAEHAAYEHHPAAVTLVPIDADEDGD